MATLRTTCPTCATDLDLEAGTVVAAQTDDGSTCAFVCPVCVDFVVRAIGSSTLSLLASIGITVVDGRRPPHPEQPPSGPPFTADDLLDLHQLLKSEDFLTQLTQPSH